MKDEFIKVLGGVENLYLFRTFAAREAPVEGGSALDLYKDLGKGEYFDDYKPHFNYKPPFREYALPLKRERWRA